MTKEKSPSNWLANPAAVGLLTKEELPTGRRRRSGEYIFKTILKKQKEKIAEALDAGWEKDKRKLKKSRRMKKRKDPAIALEDRAWVFLATLGWDLMNKDRTFRIKYQEAQIGKQIDAFAADRETALIVECKTTSSWKSNTFRNEILEIHAMKKGIYANIQKGLNAKTKIAWLFITENYRISEETKEHFKENDIHHISETELSYYEQLVEHLGPVAKYQLFGRLFAGQKIPEFDSRVPALKAEIGGRVAYSFLVEPELLLKIGYVAHRTSELDEEGFQAYQRLVKNLG